MRKILFFGIICILSIFTIKAQNVGINSTGASPDASAGLDVSFTNKGLLIPRVALTATNAAGPITSPADALLIYNTATAGVSPNNVIPGYYFWTTATSKWNLLYSGAVPTIPGNVEYWIRPTSALYIQPAYNSYAKVYDSGQTYGFSYDGGSNLIGGYFRITNTTLGASAVQGFSDVSGNQAYGYLGYNNDITVGASTIGGAAVHGRVEDANRTAIYGKTITNATVAAILAYSNVWIASYNWTENASGTLNPNANYSQLNLSNTTLGGDHVAMVGYSNRTAASGNPGYTIGVKAIAIGSTEDGVGVDAIYSGTGGYRRGGDFYADNTSTSITVSVAAHDVNRKIVGGGTVSEVIPTEQHGRITLTCPESPEYWYIDYGSVKMIDGKAHVKLDQILIDICVIDQINQIKVICQPNMEECNGVAVINKTPSGFDIVEMNGGTHSGEIDFQIVAKPKTNYGEGRFPQAKSRLVKSDIEPEKAKAENQPDYDKVFRWPNDWDVYKYDVEESTPIGGIIKAGKNVGKIKLGNGKYGESIPVKNNDLGK